jgi:hypothetical protein
VLSCWHLLSASSQLSHRWRKLLKSFYNEKKQQFDISKVPDIYDSAKYDAIHNSHLQLSSLAVSVLVGGRPASQPTCQQEEVPGWRGHCISLHFAACPVGALSCDYLCKSQLM